MTEKKRKDMNAVDFDRIDKYDLSKAEIAELMRAIAKSPSQDKRGQMINAYNTLIKPSIKTRKTTK